jgi:hypothetical protein
MTASSAARRCLAMAMIGTLALVGHASARGARPDPADAGPAPRGALKLLNPAPGRSGEPRADEADATALTKAEEAKLSFR